MGGGKRKGPVGQALQPNALNKSGPVSTTLEHRIYGIEEPQANLPTTQSTASGPTAHTALLANSARGGPDKGMPGVLDSKAAPVAATQHALSTATNRGPKPKRYL